MPLNVNNYNNAFHHRTQLYFLLNNNAGSGEKGFLKDIEQCVVVGTGWFVIETKGNPALLCSCLFYNTE